ncbi:MAG: hypothetical protein JWP09_556 [Candidatus Taylorbacteria bacterium]|nr:hypothetical protein [Candidatus Taylorbacteria bacterium]
MNNKEWFPPVEDIKQKKGMDSFSEALATIEAFKNEHMPIPIDFIHELERAVLKPGENDFAKGDYQIQRQTIRDLLSDSEIMIVDGIHRIDNAGLLADYERMVDVESIDIDELIKEIKSHNGDAPSELITQATKYLNLQSTRQISSQILDAQRAELEYHAFGITKSGEKKQKKGPVPNNQAGNPVPTGKPKRERKKKDPSPAPATNPQPAPEANNNEAESQNKISEQELNAKETRIESLARSSKKQIPYALVNELWTIYNGTNEDPDMQASIERRKNKFVEIISKRDVKIIQENKREITWSDFLAQHTPEGQEAKTLIQSLKEAIDNERLVPQALIEELYETLGSGNTALVSELLKGQILLDFQKAARRKGVSVVLTRDATIDKVGAEIFMSPSATLILGKNLSTENVLADHMPDGRGNLIPKPEIPTFGGEIPKDLISDGNGNLVPREPMPEFASLGDDAQFVAVETVGEGRNQGQVVRKYEKEVPTEFGNIGEGIKFVTNEVTGKNGETIIREDVSMREIDPEAFRAQLGDLLEHINDHIVQEQLDRIVEEFDELSEADKEKFKELYEGLAPVHHTEGHGHNDHHGHDGHGGHDEQGGHAEKTPEQLGNIVDEFLKKLQSDEEFDMDRATQDSLIGKFIRLKVEMQKVAMGKLDEEKLLKDDKKNIHIFKGLSQQKKVAEEEHSKEIEKIESGLEASRGDESVNDSYRIGLLRSKFTEILKHNIRMRVVFAEEIRELKRILEEKERELEDKRQVLEEARTNMRDAARNRDEGAIRSTTEAYQAALKDFTKMEVVVEGIKLKLKSKVDSLKKISDKITEIEEGSADMNNCEDLEEAIRISEAAETVSKEIKNELKPGQEHDEHEHDEHGHEGGPSRRSKMITWGLVGGGLLIGMFNIFATNLYNTLRGVKASGGGGSKSGGAHGGGGGHGGH